MEGVGVAASSSDPKLRHCYLRFYGLSETTMCNVPPDQDWNPGPAEYKPERLTAKSRCSHFGNKFNYPPRGWGFGLDLAKACHYQGSSWRYVISLKSTRTAGHDGFFPNSLLILILRSDDVVKYWKLKFICVCVCVCVCGWVYMCIYIYIYIYIYTYIYTF